MVTKTGNECMFHVYPCLVYYLDLLVLISFYFLDECHNEANHPKRGLQNGNKTRYNVSLSQMSEKIKISIINRGGFQQGGVNTRGASCVYCGSPTVVHTWCQKCLTNLLMARGLCSKAIAKVKEEQDSLLQD